MNRQVHTQMGFPGGSVVKNPPASARVAGSVPESGRSPGGGKDPTPVFFPGECHGQRSLAGCSLRGRKESGACEGVTLSAGRCLRQHHRDPERWLPPPPPRPSDVQGSPYRGPTMLLPFRLQQHGDGQPAPGIGRRAVSPRPGRLPRRARLGRLHAPGPGRARGGSVDPRTPAAGTPEPAAASHVPSLPLMDWPRAPKASQTRGPSEPIIPAGGCRCGFLGTAWGAAGCPQLPKRVSPRRGCCKPMSPVSYVRLDGVETMPSELGVCKSLPALPPGSRPSRESLVGVLSGSVGGASLVAQLVKKPPAMQET